MVEEVQKQLGPIEVLINAAGITRRYPAAEFPEEVFDEILAVNLKGVFLCCQEVGRHMISRQPRKDHQLRLYCRADRPPRNDRVSL